MDPNGSLDRTIRLLKGAGEETVFGPQIQRRFIAGPG